MQEYIRRRREYLTALYLPTNTSSLCSTKYTCVCLVLHSELLLSKQLYKSIVDDLRTLKTVFGQLDTLLSFLYTLDTCTYHLVGH